MTTGAISVTSSILLVLAGITSATTVVNTLMFFYQRKHDNLTTTAMLTDPSSSTFTTTSTLACSRTCAALPWCDSFFFNSISSECHVHSLIFGDDVMNVTSPGSAYYVVENDGCRSQDGFQYDSKTKLCWRVFNTPKTWPEAEAACRSLELRLVVTDTTDKKATILNSLRNFTDDTLVYLGGFRTEIDAPLLWMTGSEIDITVDRQYWYNDDEPNAGEKALGVMWVPTLQRYTLVDMPDTWTHHFVCEKL